MIEYLAPLKLGVLLLWHNFILLLTNKRPILSIEETILTSVEREIALCDSLFEQLSLVVVVE